jgi:hypothetical protein
MTFMSRLSERFRRMLGKQEQEPSEASTPTVEESARTQRKAGLAGVVSTNPEGPGTARAAATKARTRWGSTDAPGARRMAMFWSKEARISRRVEAIQSRLAQIEGELASERARITGAYHNRDDRAMGDILIASVYEKLGTPSPTNARGLARAQELESEAKALRQELSQLKSQ